MTGLARMLSPETLTHLEEELAEHLGQRLGTITLGVPLVAALLQSARDSDEAEEAEALCREKADAWRERAERAERERDELREIAREIHPYVFHRGICAQEYHPETGDCPCGAGAAVKRLRAALGRVGAGEETR